MLLLFVCGLRGAILAGGHSHEEAVGRPQSFDAKCQNWL